MRKTPHSKQIVPKAFRSKNCIYCGKPVCLTCGHHLQWCPCTPPKLKAKPSWDRWHEKHEFDIQAD